MPRRRSPASTHRLLARARPGRAGLRRRRRRLSLGAARRRDASLGLNMAAALRGGREVSGTPVEVSEGRDRGRLPRGVVVGTGGLRPALPRRCVACSRASLTAVRRGRGEPGGLACGSRGGTGRAGAGAGGSGGRSACVWRRWSLIGLGANTGALPEPFC